MKKLKSGYSKLKDRMKVSGAERPHDSKSHTSVDKVAFQHWDNLDRILGRLIYVIAKIIMQQFSWIRGINDVDETLYWIKHKNTAVSLIWIQMISHQVSVHLWNLTLGPELQHTTWGNTFVDVWLWYNVCFYWLIFLFSYFRSQVRPKLIKVY